MQYPRDRDPRAPSSSNMSPYRTPYAAHTPPSTVHPRSRDASVYATHRHHSASIDGRYTPSLATSTPSSSPTTASSSPPPSTSPFSTAPLSSAYRHSAAFSYRPREYEPARRRDEDVKVRAQSPVYPAGQRYAYAQRRPAVFEEEYDDVLPPSSLPSSPTYAFHAKAAHHQTQPHQHQQAQHYASHNPQQLLQRAPNPYASHSRTLSSSSSNYSASSPVLPSMPSVLAAPTTTQTPVHRRHQQQQQQAQYAPPRLEAFASSSRLAPLAHLREPGPPVVLGYEDARSFGRPPPRVREGGRAQWAEDGARPAAVARVEALASAVVAAAISTAVPACALRAPAVAADNGDNGEDDDGDETIPGAATFASPRRRVSFSTSAARSSSPPPVHARQGHIPVTSLLAALGPKPVRRVEERRAESRLPTPPASEHEASPGLEGGPGSSLEERREVVVVRMEEVEEVQEPVRRRQRPTLLDLLSVPGPLRSPSPPLPTVEAGAEKEGAEIVVREEMQLPTPELTPTEEVAAGDVEARVDFETADKPPSTPTPPRRRLSPPDDSPLPPSSPPEESSPVKASSLPPSSPPRDSSPAKINDSPVKVEGTPSEAEDPLVRAASRSSSPLSAVEDDALPVVVRTPSPAPRVSVERAAPSRSASAHSRPLSPAPSRAPLTVLSKPPSAVPSRAPSAAPSALSMHTAPSAVPSRASTPRYDPTENDLLSSPLSPAPSSPSVRAVSVPVPEDDVLPVVSVVLVREVVVARVETAPVQDVVKAEQKEEGISVGKEQKRPSPADLFADLDEDVGRPAKKARTRSLSVHDDALLSADEQVPTKVTASTKPVSKEKEVPKEVKESKGVRMTGTRVEVRPAKPSVVSRPFASTVPKAPPIPRPTPFTKPSTATIPRPVPKPSKVTAPSARAPSPSPPREPSLPLPLYEKPRSKGRTKRAKRPRTSEFVVSDSDEEPAKPVVVRSEPKAKAKSISREPAEAKASSSAPPTEPKEKAKKRKATTPLLDPADESEVEEPKPRKVKKRSPSLAASVFDDDEFAEALPGAKRRRSSSKLSTARASSTTRKRGRRASHDDVEVREDLTNVDWERESPLPLGELEGMVIETLATARATSMSCEVLWRALVGGRPGLGEMCRQRAVPVVKTEEGAEGDGAQEEPRAMDKAEWLHLLTHILSTGQANIGLFGRVESSASDSDNPAMPHGSLRKAAAAAVPPPPKNPPSPARKKLSFKSALRAHWYYVPERDADRERAQLIRSMMRGPGKRSETMKYKQYYWKPLAKITRWDREDEL